MPVLSILTAVVLSLGAGLSVAANGALPGDPLYPVKVHVNENVKAAFHVSAESKARFEVERLEHRLNEAGRLAAAGRLDGDAKTDVSGSIDAQVKRANAAAVSLEAGGNASAAADMHAQVESDLRAGHAILNAVAGAKSAVRDEVRDLLNDVKRAERDATESRVEADAKVSAEAQADVQVAADGAITAAGNKIREVRRFFDRMKDSVDADVSAEAEAQVILAEKTLAEAKAKADAQLSNDAFLLAKKAHRLANEARLLITFGADLDIGARVDSGRGDDDRDDDSSSSSSSMNSSSAATSSSVSSSAASSSATGDGEDDDDDNDASAGGNAEADVDVNGNGNGVNVNGNGGVQIGF